MANRLHRAALLGLLAVACAEDERGCPDADPCDIREAACQERAARLAACLRDDDPDAIAIPVEVIDAETFIEEQAAAARPIEEVSAEEVAFRRALSLLELSREVMPQDDVRTYYEQVAAFYSPADERITILDRGDALDDDATFSTLVHEMTHALQDQEGLLASMVAVKSYDEWLARRAVIEGDATFVQVRLSVKQLGYDEDEIDWDGYFSNYQYDMLELAAASEDLFVEAPMLFPYAWGSELTYRAYARGGYEAVRELYSVHRPVGTAEFMDRINLPSVVRRDDFAAKAVPVLPAGWQLSSVSHLGSWFMDQVRLRLALDVDFIEQDALSVWTKAAPAEPRPALYWRLGFGDRSEADYAAQDLQAVGQSGHDGTDAWFEVHEDTTGAGALPSEWRASTEDDLFFSQDMAARAAARHVRPCAAARRLPLPARL